MPSKTRAPWLLTLALAGLVSGLPLAGMQPPRRNLIIFVADAMRHGSIAADVTPALWSVRTNGVHFENSHAAFPTFTTANASLIATGHAIGDTGDFSNVFSAGFAMFDTGNFGLVPGTPLPFVENDRILADLADHYGGNYLGEATLLGTARDQGYHTAAVGKLGPTAIQDIDSLALTDRAFSLIPSGIIVDDSTGSSAGPPLPPALIQRLRREGLPGESPTRSNGYGATSPYNNGYPGDRLRAGTLAANTVQQQWLVDVTTRAILPMFAETPATPFALVYWSRDPDGSQHNHGDGLNALAPGVNGPTSRRGAENADANLRQILAWLDANPTIKANTDIFVTSDHGVATISRREIDRTGRPTKSEAAQHDYVDATGKVDTAKGFLPVGFLAIDLASGLKTNLFDADQRAEGSRQFRRVAIDPGAATWEHPVAGNGLIGTDITSADGSDARVMVAANGGSDLVYVPRGDAATVQRIVELLFTSDYVDAVFVDDKYGAPAGTLPLSSINLQGSTKIPRPAIVVAFKVFYLNPDDIQTAIQLSDSVLQEGQGMHGGFGRDSTFNNMAAIGPDFKTRFVDSAPVGNADIVPTLARLAGLMMPSHGTLRGRVAAEALATDRGASAAPTLQYRRSTTVDGRQTLLIYQERDGVRYLTAACLVDAAVTNGPDVCRR